ncbi:MAG: GCN5-related N-acetyltransferase, partial [Humibacillus sp.]|nr:GCN5-related N-acetyltransferase [Humibacillus sp.]
MTDYEIRALTPETWDAFAALMERNNGVFGGCWCTYFHT